MEDTLQAEKKYKNWIIALSIIIPVAVAALFGLSLKDLGYDVKPLSFLPPAYATINGFTAIVLVVAVQAIKNGNQKLHEKLIKLAIVLSVAFLVMYVAYHMTSDPTPYGGKGFLKYLYYFILITHIMLSVIIIPFVLVTYVRGITGNYERHRKIARITYPMWLYVAITGVIVYAMISPYYPY
ncbi:DUF420 domain-containing protein [Flavobacterium sp. RHBU_24]|uniref:DUF420 domain-containing protein n=1 Tax=Flavobacterium sp. RHBU_24 TaxID=3391185 RepID=UPI003984A771